MLMYKNYLFDLDGTLLPMDMEKFVKLYFSSLCKRCTPVIKIEPDTLIKAMWAGTDAMTKNDNSRTNREVFWETAGKVSGADLEKFDDLFTDYYENEFIVPKDATSFTPYAKKSIDFIKKNGGRLIAATNPIFPFVATKRRLEWAGVSPNDFELVTTYENFGCCKPTGGCLTMIVPFLVLFGVFYAVAYPLTNTLHIDSAKVTEALNYVNTIPGYTAASGATNATYQEIYFLKDFSCFQNIDAIQQIFSADQINTITMFEKGFNTFGMNLFAIPQDYGLWSPMILFPVICFASNVLTQFITMRINGKNNPMQQQQGCMKVMMYAMPLFSAYIAYIVPSAVAFYWIVSSLVSLVQSVIVGKLFSPQRMTATSEARHAALMFEQEALVQYNYVPHGLSESAEENTNSKKKKKK